DAGPKIGAHLELVAPPAVQHLHALLPYRIHALEDLLRFGDGLLVDIANKVLGGGPSLLGRLAHDDVQADAEAQFAAFGVSGFADLGKFFGNLSGGLAPCQILIDGLGGNLDARLGRAAEVKGRAALLRRSEQEAAFLDGDVLALKIDGFSSQEPPVD